MIFETTEWSTQIEIIMLLAICILVKTKQNCSIFFSLNMLGWSSQKGKMWKEYQR